MTSLETLLPHRPKRQAPRIRLVCLPFAGGAAATYRSWPAALPEFVDVCAVELPGRGTRFGEEPLKTPAGVVAELAPLETLPDLPVVYFGHSMGGRLAFTVARAGMRVDALMVSGARAAHQPPKRLRSTLSRPDLVEQMRVLGGTPREVLEDEEMLDMMIPIVRADLSVLEQTQAALDEKVACPMVALGSTDDNDLPRSEVEAWGLHAAGDFRAVEIHGGGHFFVTSRSEQVLAEVRRVLHETLARLG